MRVNLNQAPSLLSGFPVLTKGSAETTDVHLLTEVWCCLRLIPPAVVVPGPLHCCGVVWAGPKHMQGWTWLSGQGAVASRLEAATLLPKIWTFMMMSIPDASSSCGWWADLDYLLSWEMDHGMLVTLEALPEEALAKVTFNLLGPHPRPLSHLCIPRSSLLSGSICYRSSIKPSHGNGQ